MNKKKISIFLSISLVIMGACICRSVFVKKGQLIPNVNYKSKNLIIHIPKQGGKRRLVILGSGYSMSIDENNRVIYHDPLMILPSIKQYEEDTTVMSIFYPFESEGLETAGKELSDFINSKLDEYDEITLIGHSKCGVCFANASKWLERMVNIVTISVPFAGTPIADQEKFLSGLNWIEKKAYKLVFSNHRVDQDIMIDSRFMQGHDYSELKYHNLMNVISICPVITLNPIELLLMYMDLKGIKGDGVVPEASQKIYFNSRRIDERIRASHATSLEKGIKLAKKIFEF